MMNMSVQKILRALRIVKTTNLRKELPRSARSKFGAALMSKQKLISFTRWPPSLN